MSKPNLLIIFVKAPVLGQVKTRLATTLGIPKTLQLYKSMVADLLDNLQEEKSFNTEISFWPPNAQTKIISWLGNSRNYTPQGEGDLGEKMHLAFQHAFNTGYNKVTIIGSDLPTLESEHIEEAFNQLNHNNIVLGPSRDGGYYLIGLQMPNPELFRNIHWSSTKVLNQTLANANSKGLSVKLLPKKNDIDNYHDLIDLWDELQKTNLEKNLPQTTKILKDIFI